MFCQKCGTKNPDNGKFCRSCGMDMGNAPGALVENRPQKLVNHKGKEITCESAYGKIFMGVGFLIVAVILGFTGRATGWWFWMLIPAFGMLGSGVAQYVQIKSNEKGNVSFAPQNFPDRVSAGSQNTALPPSQTEYVSPDSRYKTGDLVPPSVAENTTRHLELDKEGETMTLPKRDK